MPKLTTLLPVAFAVASAYTPVSADTCNTLPGPEALKMALTAARKADNAGFNLDMWAATVDRSGVVCAVVYTGQQWGDQWPGSLVVAAQKAYTANAFSLPGLALATANLYTAVQPGGSLFGLQASNPVEGAAAYAGDAATWGQTNDPLVGQRMGGINVFGGGLPLYDAKGVLLGALGVSGDSSCADHAIAWRTRTALELDYVPSGVGPGGVDQIAYEGGWGQPHCRDAAAEDAVVKTLAAPRKKP